jgi:C4-dicarboxylate-binding protein DctP
VKLGSFCSTLACLLISALGALSADAQELKLRATHQVAITEPFWGVALKHFKDEVEKRSNNAISLEVFDKGRKFIDDEAVDAVASGAIEMGVAGLYQMSKKVPAIDIMEQPFLFNYDALIRAVTSPDSEIRRIVDKAILDKVGVRVLWWQTLGSQIIVSKGRNLTEPVQIRGQRIRTFGATNVKLTQQCGGVPVTMSAFKMHDALRDNQLDMVICSIPAVPNRKLWKVADTITRTWHAPTEYVAFINEKTWQSLSSTQRALVVEVAQKVEREIRDRSVQMEAEYYKFAVAKGMKVYDLSPDQIADWRACSAAVLDAYMNDHPEFAREFLEAYGRLRTQPCCSTAPNWGEFRKR